MPADFTKCQAEGGKIRTMPMKGGRYAHICFDKAGKSHMGDVMMKGGGKATDQPKPGG